MSVDLIVEDNAISFNIKDRVLKKRGTRVSEVVPGSPKVYTIKAIDMEGNIHLYQSKVVLDERGDVLNGDRESDWREGDHIEFYKPRSYYGK